MLRTYNQYTWPIIHQALISVWHIEVKISYKIPITLFHIEYFVRWQHLPKPSHDFLHDNCDDEKP